VTEETPEQGTHGYYFLDLDGQWRFMTPYRSEFRDAIASEIPHKDRAFDWKYKVWIISQERFEDAMDIAGRFYSMTQLFAVGVGQKRDQRMIDRLVNLQTDLRQSEQRISQLRDKITDLESEMLVLRRIRKPRISDHSVKDCLAAVKKTYPKEALFSVFPDAPNAVLRAAYRALSLATHPDRNKSRAKAAEEEQKQLNVAYADLEKARGM
jgi:hypothetical protein